MKLEQIKEESIRNNRFEAKVYNPIYLAILGFGGLGGVFGFLLAIWSLLIQKSLEETPIAKYVVLFLLIIFVFVGFWMVWTALFLKDDVIVFTPMGVSYKGSNKVIGKKKRLFDLKWSEISKVVVGNSFMVVSYHHGVYFFNITAPAISIKRDSLMWLVNYFYGSEYFPAEEIENIKSSELPHYYVSIVLSLFLFFLWALLRSKESFFNTFVYFPDKPISSDWFTVNFWFLLPILSAVLFLIDFRITKYFNPDIKLRSKNSKINFFVYLIIVSVFILGIGPLIVEDINKNFANKDRFIKSVVEIRKFEEVQAIRGKGVDYDHYIGVRDVNNHRYFWLKVPKRKFEAYKENDYLELHIYVGALGLVVVEIVEDFE